ncbi:pleckstrin homology domain-containing family M member 3-like [Salvelinus namaycush]|uniref:Pleckstrin homology domain-containing family M member 3-like n=1 Tax=Salvelinus namaycush TaxID=8040 RepID=A0A8U1BVA6_SALNM|nr:pleckstrin homology domain-containing family M member 3-like [Salvelinus namaycush]
MEGLEVEDISPALEATEDFLHCLDGGGGQSHCQGGDGFRHPRQHHPKLQEMSAALGKLSSSGVWGLLAREQGTEVSPRNVAWADQPSAFSVLALRQGKRSRARSTNDLAAHTKDTNNTTSNSSNTAFKKGHNRSRSDVNYRPSYTDNTNGLPAVDKNMLKNIALNDQREEAHKDSSSGSVVKQGSVEHREGQKGRWSICHLELTPCELRLYSLDSSGNRQLCTAYSLSHCQGVSQPQPPQDGRVLQALFFNSSTRLQLRAACQWEALDWRRQIWERVLAARPAHKQAEAPPVLSPSSSISSGGLDTRPDPIGPAEAALTPHTSHLPPARPTALPLFTKHCADVLKVGLLHQQTDLNNWRAFTFVLSRSTLQAFPTEGRGPVSEPVLHYPLASCLVVQRDEVEGASAARFQAVFPREVLRLRAESQLKAQDWMEALLTAVAAQRPQGEEGQGSSQAQPGAVSMGTGVLLRTKPSRERKQRDAQRAKRQSVTTSFLSILTCLAVEKGLTTQSFRCAGCQKPVGLSRGKAKVCCYSGRYYCQSCHQDNLFLIPARLLHNWDTNRHKVSKQAKEFLEFVYEEPLLDVQQLNPCLYEHCEGLAAVLRLRQQLQSLRAYLFSCRAAVAEDLRRRIFPREYLLQHIHLYSLADLQQVIDGKLAPFLSKVIKFASSHVFSCSQCREKGFICEMCQNGQVIYPFQESATKRCDGCGAVFHTECHQKAQPCPRCVHRELHHKRASSFWSPDDDTPGCFTLPYQYT